MICDIYIETSLSFGQRGNGIVGIAMALEDCDAKETYGFVRNCTQPQAILLGLSKALSYTSCDTLRFHLSCSSVASALNNKWLEKWENNHYLSKGKVVKNAREWHQVYENLKGRNIEIHLNEFNGFRNYLIYQSKQRMKKYG